MYHRNLVHRVILVACIHDSCPWDVIRVCNHVLPPLSYCRLLTSSKKIFNFKRRTYTHLYSALLCLFWSWYHRYTVVFSMTEHMENRNVTFKQCPPPVRRCTVNTTSTDESDDICRTDNDTEKVGNWQYSIQPGSTSQRKWARLVMLNGHIVALFPGSLLMCCCLFVFVLCFVYCL